MAASASRSSSPGGKGARGGPAKRSSPPKGGKGAPKGAKGAPKGTKADPKGGGSRGGDGGRAKAPSTRGSASKSGNGRGRDGGGRTDGGPPVRGASSRGERGAATPTRGGGRGRAGSGRADRDQTGGGRSSSGDRSVGRPTGSAARGDERARRRGAPGSGEETIEAPKAWGSVARRGLGAATGKRVSNASRVWREAVEDAERIRPGGTGRHGADHAPVASPEAADERRRDDDARAARAARAEEQWVREEEVRDEAEAAVARGSGSRPGRGGSTVSADLAEEVRAELARAVGTARSERVERRLREAADDFENERFGDAARVLRKLSDEAPSVGAVRELYGLTLYRQGKWRAAAKELEAYRLLTDSVDQHPVLADCYRALRQWRVVDELWAELGTASPSAEIVTEGRIVAAGAMADRSELEPAIRLLEAGWRFPKTPKTFHLRRAYALADLYERAGELPKARDLFGRIVDADPSFADVDNRLRALR